MPRGDWECDSRLVIFWKTFRTKWPRVYSTLYGTEFGSTNFKKKTCCLVQILPGIVSKDPQGADVSMQMSEFHGGPWATS